MIGKKIETLAKLLIKKYDRVYIEWCTRYSHELVKFRNLHYGEDCFIVGNGPSLNKMDLNVLNDYHTFGLNKIYMLFDKVKFRPSYHVAVNPLVIEQCLEAFEELKCPTFLSYRPARGRFKKMDHLHYILTTGQLAFSQNLGDKVSEGWTVTYVAMQIAYYMGFNNVYLIGVDHNFKVMGLPNEKQILRGEDVNHFDPNYFGNKEWHLPYLEGSEVAYNLARFFYGRDGRCIYDATVDGKLQVFPKISYEQALERCKKIKS